MPSLRPVPWLSPLLYGVVLVAGGYASIIGLGGTRFVPFAGGLVVLAVLDQVERRRYPVRTPPGSAVALLTARLALYALVAAADGSGMSRVLFLLLPFTAYFAFGRAAAIAIGVVCVGFVVATFELTVPDWPRQVEQVSDLLMFIVGLILTIAMAAVAVQEQRGRVRLEESHAKLREYAARVSELSATAERNRLARDIHDGLGHHLTAIAVLLEKAAAFSERDPEVAQRAVDDARQSARRALEDVRQSVRTLRAEPERFRLSSALSELTREAGDGRLNVTLDCTGDETGHDSAALLAIYRAAQEGLTNARRHAHATTVAVNVHCDPSRARLVVADDGRGFAPEREGFGLLGMRERVELAGGSVEVDTGPGTGTRLTVTIPRRTAS
ncbi:two-component sensor histidine kinase [Acrocarpospora pleiomorpha]|uniref:Oxygen sensor histidine kinase NreB n=1 Tax=Acrocarpospora pleiomorpha TaxID=90975 RepID=A0A5M3XFH2_9ACTN|nr:sensor histidine kinase [Acrocarpospora pleiomorpha]GES19492.1 two-component sensor histidine kinase [Acrocarpospora pleiomorpha]